MQQSSITEATIAALLGPIGHVDIRAAALGDAEAQRMGLATGTKFPAITDLNMGFADFLALKIVHRSGPEQTLDDEVRVLFCLEMLPLLVFELGVR